MGTGQGKLPLDVVTDNALRKRKYEQDELEGAQPLMVTTTSDGGTVFSDGDSSFGIPRVIFQSAVPFILPAGDGGANGLAFAGGGGGAFTYSVAPLVGLGSNLVGIPCFFYLPANSGGSGNAAGWYYGAFTSDTAGVIYGDRYITGNPSSAIPSSPSAFPGSPAGRITQTTGAVTGMSGLTIPAGSIGKDSEIEWKILCSGDSSAATKNYFLSVAGVLTIREQSTIHSITERLLTLRTAGVRDRLYGSRTARGVGGIDNNGTVPQYNIDTTAALPIAEVLQLGANTGTLVRYSSRISVTNFRG